MAANDSGSSSEMALQQRLCGDCSIAELFEERMNSCRLMKMLKCFCACRYDLHGVLPVEFHYTDHTIWIMEMYPANSHDAWMG